MMRNKKHLFLIIGVLVVVVAHGDSGFSGCYVPGSPQKVCQLTGEHDNQGVTSENQRNTIHTKNQTWTNYGIFGADLGMSFEHTGKDEIKRLYFLFSDITEAEEGCPGTPAARDCIAYTTDTDPEDKDANGKTHGFSLTFLSDSQGSFHPFCYYLPTDTSHKSPIFLGGMVGPREGVSYNGNMYVYCNEGYIKKLDSYGKESGYFTHSVVAKSTDDGRTFTYLYDLSQGDSGKFLAQVMAKVVEQGKDYNELRQWLPDDVKDKPVLFIWGTGNPYRKSNVYLACQPLEDIENKSTIRYYTGLPGKDMWNTDESKAQPLFKHYDKDGNEIKCMGEFSVAWNQYLNKWIMLYNFWGIYFRVADYPWGPWSKNAVLFNAGRDNGYCNFIHRTNCDYLYEDVKCDVDDDKSTPPVHRKDVWGDAYGPYIIDRFTEEGPNQSTTIYFTMSTWNPYQTVLMKTTLFLLSYLPGDVSPKDVYPQATCGDCVIDIFDILAEVDFALEIQTPTPCQKEMADVPTGSPPDCYVSDGSINILDVMTIIDQALGRPNCVGYCLEHVCNTPPSNQAPKLDSFTATLGNYYPNQGISFSFSATDDKDSLSQMKKYYQVWVSYNVNGFPEAAKLLLEWTEGTSYTIPSSGLKPNDMLQFKGKVRDTDGAYSNVVTEQCWHVVQNAQSTPMIKLDYPSVAPGTGCTIVNGTAAPSSGATITKINWNWGDGTSDDQWFPYLFPGYHTYYIPHPCYSDYFDVVATVYDSKGKSAQDGETVYVYTIPPPLCM